LLWAVCYAGNLLGALAVAALLDQADTLDALPAGPGAKLPDWKTLLLRMFDAAVRLGGRNGQLRGIRKSINDRHMLDVA
jgi:hypothetical protein